MHRMIAYATDDYIYATRIIGMFAKCKGMKMVGKGRSRKADHQKKTDDYICIDANLIIFFMPQFP